MKNNNEINEVYFNQIDVEARLGFKAAKYPDVKLLPSIVLAMLVLGIFYCIIKFLIPDTLISKMFLQRTSIIIPFLILLLSSICCSIIFFKYLKLCAQKKAFKLKIFPSDPDFVLAEGNAKDFLHYLLQRTDNVDNFVLFCRVSRALASLNNIGRISDAVSMLESQAQTDEDELQSSYTLIAGFIWGIPVLGFIGTVLGLSQSIGGFGSVLSSAGGIEELTNSLTVVTGGLSTAFETTLEGLVCALCIQLLVVTLRKKEEQFLDQCKEYCHKNIISRLRTIDRSAN